MTELELLNALAGGHGTFCREEHPDLDDIDERLKRFADRGYVPRVIRAVFPSPSGPRVDRVDVIGGLTPIGEMRRTQLARQPLSSS